MQAVAVHQEAAKHPAGDVGNGWNASMHTYTVGPKLSVKSSGFRPFVHALFSGVRLGAGGFSTTGFGMMLSGGFDVLRF